MTEYRKMQYPIQGKSGKFETSGFVKSVGFRVDAGAQVAGTAELLNFKKGDVILGFRVKVTEDVAGTSSTVQMGFTGKTMLSAAIAEATLVPGYCFGPDESADAAVYTLPADDTFDCIVAVATLTAGKFDVDVIYLPAEVLDMGDDFHEYVTA
ncbi:hypothetical protein ACFL4H_00065 [Candidatus Neomarinimicrobiota bacterium]